MLSAVRSSRQMVHNMESHGGGEYISMPSIDDFDMTNLPSDGENNLTEQQKQVYVLQHHQQQQLLQRCPPSHHQLQNAISLHNMGNSTTSSNNNSNVDEQRCHSMQPDQVLPGPSIYSPTGNTLHELVKRPNSNPSSPLIMDPNNNSPYGAVPVSPDCRKVHTPFMDHLDGQPNGHHRHMDNSMMPYGPANGMHQHPKYINEVHHTLGPLNLTCHVAHEIESINTSFWKQDPDYSTKSLGGLDSPRHHHDGDELYHHHYPRTHSRTQSLDECSTVSYRRHEAQEISDDVLLQLPVRELNKQLHGKPREEVVKLKQRRRTLKNRGYAQNCRTKRLHQRNTLQERNSRLESELARFKNLFTNSQIEAAKYKTLFNNCQNDLIKSTNLINELHNELNKVHQDRDNYKTKYMMFRRNFHNHNNNTNSDGTVASNNFLALNGSNAQQQQQQQQQQQVSPQLHLTREMEYNNTISSSTNSTGQLPLPSLQEQASQIVSTTTTLATPAEEGRSESMHSSLSSTTNRSTPSSPESTLIISEDKGMNFLTSQICNNSFYNSNNMSSPIKNI